MLVVHVHARVRPGRAGEFLDATLANAQASLAEPGVLRFDVIQDQDDPDGDAAAAHKQTAHYAAWRDRVAEMMARPRESARFSAVFPEDGEGWETGPSGSP